MSSRSGRATRIQIVTVFVAAAQPLVTMTSTNSMTYISIPEYTISTLYPPTNFQVQRTKACTLPHFSAQIPHPNYNTTMVGTFAPLPSYLCSSKSCMLRDVHSQPVGTESPDLLTTFLVITIFTLLSLFTIRIIAANRWLDEPKVHDRKPIQRGGGNHEQRSQPARGERGQRRVRMVRRGSSSHKH